MRQTSCWKKSNPRGSGATYLPAFPTVTCITRPSRNDCTNTSTTGTSSILQGHNERVKRYYQDQWNACIPDTEQNKDWTNKPKISVLMAVHNGEKFLPQALESIYRQTCQDFEFIIVDDASSDRTPEILLDRKDSRTAIYRNAQRQGLTKSLNVGLKLCRGEYVARMDADDVSLPQRFEKQLKVLEGNPACLVVGCWCARIDAEGKGLRPVAVADGACGHQGGACRPETAWPTAPPWCGGPP